MVSGIVADSDAIATATTAQNTATAYFIAPCLGNFVKKMCKLRILGEELLNQKVAR